MKRFNVTVNGVSYDVTVEEVGANQTVPTAPVQSAPVQNAPVQKPAAAKPAAANSGSVVVKAPMPGNIIKINVKPGASVKKGDVLCVLEAMKMENDICAPSDGTVATVNVSQGASVQTEEVLVTLN